jgi:diguanylate cyclase (GGDEF)-like protein/PAS domain S-box-containing protein
MSRFSRRLARLLTWRPRLSVTARIAIGVASLTIALLVVLDLAFRIFPNDETQLRAVRERSAVDLGVQISVMLRSEQAKTAMGDMLQQVVTAMPDVDSIGVRRSDGMLVAATPGHEEHWVRPPHGESTLTNVIVPLLTQGQAWGSVEVHYKPLQRSAAYIWLHTPLTITVLGVSTLGLLLYFVYLKRVLKHLDPSEAVPERVRAAFNTLTEGLLVIDRRGYILLANDSFMSMCPERRLVGHPIDDVGWLDGALSKNASDPPWLQVMKTRQPILRMSTKLAGKNGEARHALLNFSAICDASGTARGCLLTLDDVTELDSINSQLRDTLAELQNSQEKVERQNEELQKLARIDPLTGCLNRRAFFANADELFAHALAHKQPLTCLMTDIDKFKSFNDDHGHTVGDAVLQQVARLLGLPMRPQDLLCRYGGEEFCILLPGFTLNEGASLAESIRGSIENEAGMSIATMQRLRITSSFGVAELHEGDTPDLRHLIERADRRLYIAKNTGRNRVCATGGEAAADASKGRAAA